MRQKEYRLNNSDENNELISHKRSLIIAQIIHEGCCKFMNNLKQYFLGSLIPSGIASKSVKGLSLSTSALLYAAVKLY